ncbi:hypothetical protein LCGC14_1688510 [marine sediment metagenome]|uniref:Glycosyltransferase 2-like domain-containing protein n=1 Tax=marine sediment metagenome TaxID=412755 RepID=A0A0F9HLL8_9ZZZZ
MDLDITTTATVRPEILGQTLDSFRTNLLKGNHNYRLIINIDPIGEQNKTQEDVLKVARSFFSNIVYNVPEECSFTKAVIWCWKQSKTDYVFHLEDDWIMLTNVNIDHIFSTINKYPQYSSFALSQYVLNKSHEPPPSLITNRQRICLNPTFIRYNFIEQVINLMNCNADPERQLGRRGKISRKLKTKHAIYTECGYSPIVHDIGREWRNNQGYRKTKSGSEAWQRKE